MRPVLVVAGILLLSFPGPAGAAEAGIVGAWRHPDDAVVVQVVPVAGGYRGTVVEAPDARLLGRTLFRDLRAAGGPGRWQGEVFAPRRQDWYAATFVREEDGRLAMSVRVGIFSKVVAWRPAGAVRPVMPVATP
ncbi:MAG: hypothetical protein VKP57_08205 [Candidatus Sericytochromatia bacterium]|nr:hypothetical protein [Candidatus Sericytochromatia bacterium]